MYRRRLAASMAMLALAGIAVVGLRHRDGDAAVQTATASFVSSDDYDSRGHGDELAVFRDRQVPSDMLPGFLRQNAVDMAKPPAGMGYWRGNESRRILRVGGATLYVWPIGKNGLCSGMRALEIVNTQCRPWGPDPDDLVVTIRGTSGGRSFLGGLIGRDVTGLSVDARDLTCDARPARSGFLCTGPAAAGGVSALMRLRDGSVRTIHIG